MKRKSTGTREEIESHLIVATNEEICAEMHPVAVEEASSLGCRGDIPLPGGSGRVSLNDKFFVFCHFKVVK